MIDNKTPIWIGICLIVTLVIAGCVSPTPPAPVQTPAPTPAPTTAIQTVLPTTPEATVVTVVSTRVTPKPSGTVIEKEILHDTGILTTKTYKTYDFKDMGFKFIYPGDKFRITIKAEKPVLGLSLIHI